MRNKVFDVLNGASFMMQTPSSLALSNLNKLMLGVKQYPSENWVDAFSEGQTMSKQWLIDSTVSLWGENAFTNTTMVGGWVGLLPLVVSSRGLVITKWHSVDLSLDANNAAELINGEYLVAHTADMYEFDYKYSRLVINTSCEHIGDIAEWLKLLPSGCRVVVQSNNMFGIDDHINCVNSCDEFESKLMGLVDIKMRETLELPWHGWKRFMLLGVVQ